MFPVSLKHTCWRQGLEELARNVLSGDFLKCFVYFLELLLYSTFFPLSFLRQVMSFPVLPSGFKVCILSFKP